MKVPFKGFAFTLLFCLAFSSTSVYAGAGLSLEETPSWRVILFLLAFLVLSIIVEHSIHKLDHYLVHHGKLGPRAALTKIKDELMLMGFISLVLIIMEDMILAQCSDVSTAGVPVLGAKCVAELHLDSLLTGSSSGSSSSSSSSSSTSGSGSRRLASKSTLAMMDYCCGVGGSSSAASSNSTSSRMLLEYSTDYVGKGNRRELGGAADDCQCPCGQTPFIEQASLHQIHVLIFAYAATHIIYGCVVMAFAQMKVSVWKEWERWAENPEIHIKKFDKPSPRSSNKCVRNVFPFVEQMYTNAFNSFGYAAMRKLFIVRHNLDNHFDFFKHVSEGLSHDFAEVLGIQWWMWFVAIAQILAEGYALPAVGAYISLFISLTVGWKLVFIAEELTMSLANHYDTDGDGNVDDDEMAVMLKVGKVKDNLTSMEARFWCNNPHIMLTLMQFCMWQNGQTLAGLLFYGAYFNGMEGSCYYVNRGIVPMVLSALVCIITLLHAAFVTVPTFSMVTHMASHKKKKFDPHAHKAKHGHAPVVLHGIHRSHTIDQHALTSVVPHIGHTLDDDEDDTLEDQIEVLEQDLKKLKQRKEEKDAEDFNMMSPSDHRNFDVHQDDNISGEEKTEKTQVQMAPPPSDEPPVSVQEDTIPAPPSEDPPTKVQEDTIPAPPPGPPKPPAGKPPASAAEDLV